MDEAVAGESGGAEVLLDAAQGAPDAPGVYFMLDRAQRVVYIGKAGSVRRRLQQHAKAAATGASPRDADRARVVAGVRWELWPTEDAAATREVDLVVAFAPRLNAAMTDAGRWVFVVLDDGQDSCVLRLSARRGPARSTYGCFPHLGVGVSGRSAIRCSEGYASFVRLLWAATTPADDRARFPAAIAGVSPPAEAVLPPLGGFGKAVRALLAGTSVRAVDHLLEAAIERRPPYMLPALRRDSGGARAFFDHGPRAIRDLRRRHGIRGTTVTRDEIVAALATEVRGAIGDVHLVIRR